MNDPSPSPDGNRFTPAQKAEALCQEAELDAEKLRYEAELEAGLRQLSEERAEFDADALWQKARLERLLLLMEREAEALRQEADFNADALEVAAGCDAFCKQMRIWWNAFEKHVSAEPASEIDLAEGLRAWRKIDESTALTPDEQGALDARKQRFTAQLETAIRGQDCAFFERLWKASQRERARRTHPLDASGATVIAFQSLRYQLGRGPTKPEVQSWVEQWRKERGLLPVENWHRIFRDPAIAALFHQG